MGDNCPKLVGDKILDKKNYSQAALVLGCNSFELKSLELETDLSWKEEQRPCLIVNYEQKFCGRRFCGNNVWIGKYFNAGNSRPLLLGFYKQEGDCCVANYLESKVDSYNFVKYKKVNEQWLYIEIEKFLLDQNFVDENGKLSAKKKLCDFINTVYTNCYKNDNK